MTHTLILIQTFCLFQYGFVFGVISLSGFIFCPFFGHFGEQIGPKCVVVLGGIAQGICCILFGQLTHIENVTLFIMLSYLLRLYLKEGKNL